MTQVINLRKSFEEALESFEGTLLLSKSPDTVYAYVGDVARWLDYAQNKSLRNLANTKSEMITSYLGLCTQLGRSSASIQRYFQAIKAFFRHLRRTKHVTNDPTIDIDAPKSVAVPPYVPSLQEMNQILQMPNTCTETGTRDRAILELLYSSGLRASELCDLELESIGAASVRIDSGKGSKTRTVPVTRNAMRWIQDYIRLYRGHEPGYLFVTLVGRKRISRKLLCEIVQQHANKAGYKRVSTHTLRHACATHLLEAGADIRLIQDVLGHRSIATTQRYTQLSSCKIDEMFQKFHPQGVLCEKIVNITR